MTKILTLQQRLDKVQSEADLRAQLNQALHVLQLVQQSAKQQLPVNIRMMPNATRMRPELHRKVQRARHTYDRLRAGYTRYTAQLKHGKPLR